VTLYPGTSLVENIGQDGSGTHSVPTNSHASDRGSFPWPMRRIPIHETVAARDAVARSLARDRATLRARVGSLVTRWTKR